MDILTASHLDDEDHLAIGALCAAAFAADRHPALSDHHRLALENSGAETTDLSAFMARDRRRLVGYAQLLTEPTEYSLEMVVHPMSRRVPGPSNQSGTIGVESADETADPGRDENGADVLPDNAPAPPEGSAGERLLDAALDHVAFRGGGTVKLLVAHATEHSDQKLAAKGFAPVRDVLQLRCALPLDAVAAWPPGAAMRAFVPGRDEADWLRVNARAFADHPDQGGWGPQQLAQRLKEPWFDANAFLLAHIDNELAGFCWMKTHRSEALAEIYVIGVDPDFQGLGLGRALAVAGLATATTVRTGMLYVEGANTAAIGLYRSLGFTEHQCDRWYTTVVEPRAVTES